MNYKKMVWVGKSVKYRIIIAALAVLLLSQGALVEGQDGSADQDASAPTPVIAAGHPVDWWFVFKFNAYAFPGCSSSPQSQCPFGGSVQSYTEGQQFVYASSEKKSLQKGDGCIGVDNDPVASTFDEIYNGNFHYVVWNDQFYDDPPIAGCSQNCSSPWGHSKGLVAWDDAGNGLVMQVSTPSWPGSGNKDFPRKQDGNTLGCITDDDVKVSQHFFAVKLTKADLIKVLKALRNASVVTDTTNPQVVSNGGPSDVQQLVSDLGTKSNATTVIDTWLSTGIELVSKPSHLHVPPWQMMSSVLGGIPLRAATWWATPKINSTEDSTAIACWDDTLRAPGAVQIATSGSWGSTQFSLKGGPSSNGNHAKIGISTDSESHFSIFGDLNQQGTLSGQNCGSSQNGRGGLFYVIDDKTLNQSIGQLINGDTAPE